LHLKFEEAARIDETAEGEARATSSRIEGIQQLNYEISNSVKSLVAAPVMQNRKTRRKSESPTTILSGAKGGVGDGTGAANRRYAEAAVDGSRRRGVGGEIG